MRVNPEWIMVGKVRRLHGNAGELLVESLTDVSERFEAGAELYLERPGSTGKSLLEVEYSRLVEKGVILKLRGVGSRKEAERLSGAGLLIPFTMLSPAGAGSYYPHELIGCSVYQGGELIGIVARFREAVANPYLEISPAGSAKQILIPFVRDVITLVDIEAGRIEISEAFLR